jgi:plastocyanin
MKLKLLLFALFTNYAISQTNHDLNWGMSSTNQQITIDVGDSVTWTWGNGTHNLRSTGGVENFDSGYFTGPGAQFTYTFTMPGITTYICDPHPNSMYGAVTVLGTASTNEINNFEFEIYPNPVIDIVNLSFENNFENMFKVEIYDALGRLSFSQNKFSTGNKLSLNISELERGIYILKLYNNNKISVKRIIKK